MVRDGCMKKSRKAKTVPCCYGKTETEQFDVENRKEMPNSMVKFVAQFQRKEAEKAKKANKRKTQTSTSSYLQT